MEQDNDENLYKNEKKVYTPNNRKSIFLSGKIFIIAIVCSMIIILFWLKKIINKRKGYKISDTDLEYANKTTVEGADLNLLIKKSEFLNSNKFYSLEDNDDRFISCYDKIIKTGLFTNIAEEIHYIDFEINTRKNTKRNG
jgi:hypothetical protein